MTCLLILPASGADVQGPALAFSNDTTTESGEQTVASTWLWTWGRPGSAIGYGDEVVYHIEWEETYEDGERVAFSVKTLVEGALGRSDCAFSVDRDGEGSISGAIQILALTPRACVYGSVGIDDGDDLLCTAAGSFVSERTDGHHYQAANHHPSIEFAAGPCGL